MAVFIAALQNTTPLGVGNWTSADVITDRAAVIGVLVSSDNNLTLNFNWSNDGISTVLTESESITGGTPAEHFRPIKAKYLNIELVNGGTNTALVVQGFFFSLASATLAIRNLGSGTPVANLNKLGLRSLKSSDASITISNTADEIDLVSAGGGTTVVSLDDNVQVTEAPAGQFNVGVGLDTANSLNLGWNTPLPASGTNSVNLGYGRGTGNNSVCIGGGATGAGNTSNTGIVSIGSAVCPSGQGVNSVAIGYLLGSPANAVSTSTVAIGAVALASGSASTAVAIGNSCMSLGAGKNANNTVAIGDNCLFSASNSQSPGTSVFIGKSCASSSTSLASNNVFVGPYCGSAGTYGSGNVIQGYYAAYNKTVGANCVIIGSNTDFTATTYGNNTVSIGHDAGSKATQGADAVIIGHDAGNGGVGQYSVANGFQALGNGATPLGTVAIGASTLYHGYTTVGTNYITAVGHEAGYMNASTAADNAGGTTLLGSRAGYNATKTAASSGISNNTIVGNTACQTASLNDQNVVIGSIACSGATLAGAIGHNTVLGYNSCPGLTLEGQVTALGALTGGSSGTINQGATLVGYNAGNSTTIATYEICLGANCTASNVAGRINIGANAEAIQTAATAGAQTLPSNPAGFMRISHNGTLYKIPLYND